MSVPIRFLPSKRGPLLHARTRLPGAPRPKSRQSDQTKATEQPGRRHWEVRHLSRKCRLAAASRPAPLAAPPAALGISPGVLSLGLLRRQRPFPRAIFGPYLAGREAVCPPNRPGRRARGLPVPGWRACAAERPANGYDGGNTAILPGSSRSAWRCDVVMLESPQSRQRPTQHLLLAWRNGTDR